MLFTQRAVRHSLKQQPGRKCSSCLKYCSQGSRSALRPSMDPKLKRIIETINSRRKHDFTWERGQPVPQPYYTWHDGQWKARRSGAGQSASTTQDGFFSIMSWNIDFMRSFTNERMEKALSFLEQYISQISSPSIIMLNEMLVSDLRLIQGQSWVREKYHLTDVSEDFWESGYYGEQTRSLFQRPPQHL